MEDGCGANDAKPKHDKVRLFQGRQCLRLGNGYNIYVRGGDIFLGRDTTCLVHLLGEEGAKQIARFLSDFI